MVCDGIPRMVILTPRKRNFITTIKLPSCVFFFLIIIKKKREKNIHSRVSYRWTGENQLVR